MVSRGVVVGALSGTAVLGVLAGAVAGGLGGDGRSRVAASATGPAASIPGPPISATASPPPSRPPTSSAPATASSSAAASAAAGVTAGRAYVLALGDGRVMDLGGNRRKDGAPVVVRAPGKDLSRWVVRAAADGTVRLQSGASGMCLGVHDGRAVQDRCDGRDEGQLWRVAPAGAGVRVVTKDGRRALAPGGRDDGDVVLDLVPGGRGAVWTAYPA